MPVYLIDKIKPKNNDDFKLVDDYDINWTGHVKISPDNLPQEVATKDDLTQAIAKAPHMRREVISQDGSLPRDPDQLTIYMVPNIDNEDWNEYTEYVYVNEKWGKTWRFQNGPF